MVRFENRQVTTSGNLDSDGMITTLEFIVFAETLSHPVGFHTHYGILFRVEILAAPQSLHRDDVLRQGRLALKVLLTHVLEKTGGI
jgi:hypothetical protein